MLPAPAGGSTIRLSKSGLNDRGDPVPTIPLPIPGAALCVVVGFPVSHSRSPFIHRAFAEQCGLPLQYERMEVQPGQLRAALASLRALDCRGVNVTVPLKGEAAALAMHGSEAVRLAGVANTLWWDAQGDLQADNTDGTGLLRDLRENWGLNLARMRVIILGAGGAAAGIIPPLLGAGVATLTVVNRDQARAEALVRRFSGLGTLAALPMEAPGLVGADLIINATSAGLQGGTPAFPPAWLTPETRCYDLSYAASETPFLARCRASVSGCLLRDGLGMLVEQAAESFARWHGFRPSTPRVLAALRGRR